MPYKDPHKVVLVVLGVFLVVLEVILVVLEVVLVVLGPSGGPGENQMPRFRNGEGRRATASILQGINGTHHFG